MILKASAVVLDVIDEENCANVGTFFLNDLAKLRDEFEILGDVRGKGLIIGVELVDLNSTFGFQTFNIESQMPSVGFKTKYAFSNRPKRLATI